MNSLDAIRDALSLENVRGKEIRGIAEIVVEPFLDSEGDDSIKISIILDDSEANKLNWSDLQPFASWVRNTAMELDTAGRYAHVRFRPASAWRAELAS